MSNYLFQLFTYIKKEIDMGIGEEQYWKMIAREALDLLTLMRWTTNTKSLCERVEKFIWEYKDIIEKENNKVEGD